MELPEPVETVETLEALPAPAVERLLLGDEAA